MADLRIVIADDHPIVRKGLRLVIEEEPDLKVVAEASDGKAALTMVEAHCPHVVVLDLDMPKLDGFAVASEIRARKLPVEILFLTIHSEVDLLDKAIELGAKGYIQKESALAEIVNGLRSVAAGTLFASSGLLTALLERRTRLRDFENKSALSALTPTERRVLYMVAEGKASKEIGAALHIHHRTVETHRGNICQKLELSGPNVLLRFALQHKADLLP